MALTQSRNSYQNALHEHQLKLLEIEQAQRQQEIETLKLAQELSHLEQSLAELSAVTTPYSGTVRKVTITGQTGCEIAAEISLVISEE